MCFKNVFGISVLRKLILADTDTNFLKPSNINIGISLTKSVQVWL